jgi:hypothetical protein
MKKILSSLGIVFLGAYPTLVFAQNKILDLVDYGRNIVDSLIPLAFAAALLFFFYGIAKYIFRIGGDGDAVEDAKRIMVWGIIALFVIASVWGIVQFFRDEIGIDPIDTINPPTVTNL